MWDQVLPINPLYVCVCTHTYMSIYLYLQINMCVIYKYLPVVLFSEETLGSRERWESRIISRLQTGNWMDGDVIYRNRTAGQRAVLRCR